MIKKQSAEQNVEYVEINISNRRKALYAPSYPPKANETKEFYNLPTSPASNLIMEVLEAGEDISDLPARKKKINHGTQYIVPQKSYNVYSKR